MTDITGIHHDVVADLLEEHEPHHAPHHGTSDGHIHMEHAHPSGLYTDKDWQSRVGAEAPAAESRSFAALHAKKEKPGKSGRHHSTHAEMVSGSKQTEFKLRSILNSLRGTPVERLMAERWLKHNYPEMFAAEAEQGKIN